MATVSSNIKEQYAPLKEVAKSSCFGVVHSNFPPSKTSGSMRHQLPLTSHKRSSCIIPDKGTTSDDADNDFRRKYRRTSRSMKHLRTDDEDGQPVWQMR